MVYCIKRIKQTVVYITTLCVCLTLLACVPLESDPPEATNIPLPTHTPPVPTATIDWFPPPRQLTSAQVKHHRLNKTTRNLLPTEKFCLKMTLAMKRSGRPTTRPRIKSSMNQTRFRWSFWVKKLRRKALARTFYRGISISNLLLRPPCALKTTGMESFSGGTVCQALTAFGPTARGSLWLTVFCLRG